VNASKAYQLLVQNLLPNFSTMFLYVIEYCSGMFRSQFLDIFREIEVINSKQKHCERSW